MKKQLLALALSASCLCTALAGCVPQGAASVAPSSASSATAQKKPALSTSVEVSIGPEPRSLDPARSDAADTDAYCALLFEGLYKVDATGAVALGVAQKATASADKRTWTFSLRADARWSDGQPVKAADFVYAWQRNIALEDARDRVLFRYLKNGAAVLDGTAQPAQLGVRAVDDSTLQVELRAPCPFLDQLLTRPIFMPLRRDVCGADDKWSRSAKEFVSNGPLKLSAWEHKDNIALVKDEGYYNAAAVTTGKLTCVLAEDDGARFSLYDSGDAGYVSPLPVSFYTRMRERGDFMRSAQQGVTCLQFNTKAASPLQDSRVRRALSLAIDRDKLATTATGMRFSPSQGLVPAGYADAAKGSDFRATGKALFATKAADYPQNLAQARALLQEAGYGNGLGQQLTLTVPVDTLSRSVADAVVKMWKDALGVDCKVEEQAYKDFVENARQGKLQIAYTQLSPAYNDAAALLEQLTPHSAANAAQWADAQYLSLLDKARSATDTGARFAALHAAEARLAAEMPVAPLFTAPSMGLCSATLSGVHTTPLGLTLLAYLYPTSQLAE